MNCPARRAVCLRPAVNGAATSIGSIAIGQEVGVTPIQLVSMVSTIANGGVYLPPHVLMPAQLSALPTVQRQTPRMQCSSRSSLVRTCPIRLPAGAHRVISTMTAAQMRKMMEGVVLFGTGKPAQLNGYSSGGKTGTAQKIDPATHLYSKTMHIASFAGFAPVNNPVIAVAVVMDNPRAGPSYYGTAVSAPVFAEVAQQVLEYLGVPHDIEVRPSHARRRSPRPAPSRKTTTMPIRTSQRALRRGQRSARRRSAASARSQSHVNAAVRPSAPPITSGDTDINPSSSDSDCTCIPTQRGKSSVTLHPQLGFAVTSATAKN